MRVFSVKEDYILQFIVGLNVNMVWRSQPDMAFSISFNDFKKFMDVNYETVSSVLPPYKTAIETNDEGLKFKVYMYFLAYSQYNEVVISHGNRLDATMLIPSCDTKKVITLEDIEFTVSKLDSKSRIASILSSITKGRIDVQSLSDHNKLLLILSIFYMYRSRCAYEQFNVGGF